MACNKPLFRLPTIIEAVPAQFQHRVRHGAIIMNRKDRDYLIKKHGKKEEHFQQIPCGCCSACRLEYSRQWAIRCVLESSYHKNNWFVTLTYDNEHLPRGLKCDFSTGEILQNQRGESVHVLDETDMTNFMKRLRITAERAELREVGDIRYFYAGEYGDLFERPHYHILLFGLDLPDLQVDYVRRNNVFYKSEWLQKIWGNGRVVIGEMTFDTAAYTARYVMKKQKGKGAKEMRENVKTVFFDGKQMTVREFRDEFCRMSRRPGIARQYFEDNKDKIYETDSLYVQVSKGLMKVKPCRYYDSLYDVDHRDEMDELKRKRKSVGKAASEERKKRTSLTEVEYLELKEQIAQERVKKLKREVE